MHKIHMYTHLYSHLHICWCWLLLLAQVLVLVLLVLLVLVLEQQNQSDDQSVDCEQLHECQRKQQHTAKIICNVRLATDAIDATA